MKNTDNKFCNMDINLIKEGKIYSEKAAVRNIFKKDSGTFFDIYFYRLQKCFMVDIMFIHDVYDADTDKFYNDIKLFIADFYKEKGNLKTQNSKTASESNPFKDAQQDIIILLFVARSWGFDHKIKDKIICDYIKSNFSFAEDYSDQYLQQYVSNLSPASKDFYQALETLKSKTPKQAENLVKEVVKICKSSSQLHYTQRMYLAEIMQVLRNFGVNIAI